MVHLMHAFRHYLSLVKFSHTIFALPFAGVGFAMGLMETPDADIWGLGVKVLLCMVFARNTAMAFNRLVDAHFDEKNPRTAIREIPAGILARNQVALFVGFNALAFIATTFFINPLCFYLSPVALAVIMGYSYTKRFTPLCHLVLGVGLGLAPLGAYLAVTASFDWPVIFLSLAVLSWVGGFDIIYALQDEHFDRNHQLQSIPAWLGGRLSLTISRGLHVFSALNMGVFGYMLTLSLGVQPVFLVLAIAVFVTMLAYQHTLVRADDLRRVNLAFFTSNGVASLLFGLLMLLAIVLG